MKLEDLERVITVLRSDQPWSPGASRIWDRRNKRVTKICPVSAIADEFGIPWEVDEVNTARLTSARIYWSWHYVLEWVQQCPALKDLPARWIQRMFDHGMTVERIAEALVGIVPIDDVRTEIDLGALRELQPA